MRRQLLLIALVASCTSAISAASLAWPIQVSPNGRYFVEGKGQPVFWLGTTQWELFRGYTLEDARLILDKSQDKGFVFVQTMLMGVGDGTRANVYGQKPWRDDDPLTPNEAYFQNVDAVVRAARERDLILYMMPYHQTCRKRITGANARSWAKWLALRYKEVPNIVWSLIPEAKPEFVPLLRELAAGLREGDGGAHLITVEPDPSPYSSSFIHGEKWLDFNSLQTWKGVELIYPMVTHDYQLKPVKPVLMAEGAYEQGSEYGFEVSPLWVRRQAYYSYLAGGHHAYGHNDSWRILPTWRQALDAPGARQMGILRRVFEGRPEWWRLVPDQSLFAAGGQTQGRVLYLAARHAEGLWAMIYLADPAEFSIGLASLQGSHVSASWVNPVTGESGAGGSYVNAGVQSFTTPVGWEDSLLILESRADAPAQSEGIRFTVTHQTLHRIDRRMFGQFMERPSWGEIGVEGALVPGTNCLQPKVRELLEAMKLPIIRFPGGTDVDYMDWRDMVSNVPGRAPERPISTGHLGHKVSNHFGYDEFLQFCEQTGAEAIVVVNFRDGLLQKKPLSEAAAQAAALVAYYNAPVGAKLPDGRFDWPGLRAENGRTKPYGVRYFQIGNETWAFLKEAQKLAPQDLAAYYVTCLKAYIDAMKAVDPKIEIIVDGDDGSMRGAVPLALEQLRGRIDYFATHFYRPWGMTEIFRGEQKIAVEKLSAEDIWYAWTAITEFDEQGQSVYQSSGLEAARRAGCRVAITEWNWNGQWRAKVSPLNSRWAKGVGAAGFIHAMMRSGDVIDIGCQSMLVGMGWGISAVFTDPAAIKDPVYLPTGQLTAFYSKRHGDRLVRVETSGVPTYEQPYRMGGIGPRKKVAVIDVVATASETAVFIHAINRSFDKAMEVTIDLPGFRISDGAVHRVVQGRLNDVPKNDQPEQIGHESELRMAAAKPLKVTLPERSVSCVEIPLAR